MKKLNTPSFNHLIPRVARIRAIQELYNFIKGVFTSSGLSEEAKESLHLDSYALKNGMHPNLAAGLSEDLIITSDEGLDHLPVDISTNEKYISIVGVQGYSVKWNQLIQNADFSEGTEHWKVTNGTLTATSSETVLITRTSAEKGSGTLISEPIEFKEDSVYYIGYSIKTSGATTSEIGIPGHHSNTTSISNTSWRNNIGWILITERGESFTSAIEINPWQTNPSTTGQTAEINNVWVINLTAIFGKDEPTTASALTTRLKTLLGDAVDTSTTWPLPPLQYFEETTINSNITALISLDENDNVIGYIDIPIASLVGTTETGEFYTIFPNGMQRATSNGSTIYDEITCQNEMTIAIKRIDDDGEILSNPEMYLITNFSLPQTLPVKAGGSIVTQTKQGIPSFGPDLVTKKIYTIEATSILKGLPQNYISKKSMENFLSFLYESGVTDAPISMNWDSNDKCYNFSFYDLVQSV